MARDLRNPYVASCPTYGLWFEIFILSMHKRMEYEVIQDQAVTLEAIHKVIEGFEFDYYSNESNEGKECITDQAFFVLVAFLVVFRGEESLYDGDEDKCQILYAALPSRSTFKG